VLEVRASISEGREAIADQVLAERTRRRVAAICRNLLLNPIRDDEGNIDDFETFCVRASLVEALTGSSQPEEAEKLHAMIAENVPESWMLVSLDEQLARLRALLTESSGRSPAT
jgi:hypothetical protein